MRHSVYLDDAGAGVLGDVTLTGRNAVAPLSEVAAADAFWQLLPRNDPIAAQKAVSRALGELVAQGDPGINQLQAVLALDRRAPSLVDALLVNFGGGDLKLSALEKGHWQSAFELCWSFGEVYGHALQMVRNRQHYRRWREYLPSILLRYFQHRQLELLLRPFVDDRSAPFSWRDVHEVYRYADLHGLLHGVVPVSRRGVAATVESTLGREYLHILIQGLVNGGQLPPHDAFWASQGIPRWSKPLALAADRVPVAGQDFVVELDRDAGLARSSVQPAGACLCLDTAPALVLIRDEIASLRDSLDAKREPSGLSRGRRLKLLGRLRDLLAPELPFITRRGERKPVAMAVEIVIGFAQIVHAMRKKSDSPAGAPPHAAPEFQETTITAFGGFTGVRPRSVPGDGNTDSAESIANLDSGYPLWKLVDRSDSGCRLRGPVFDSHWLAPGVLIAFREDATVPWTVAIVRRFAKLAGNRAEIGVELIGKNPRGVKVTIDAASEAVRAQSIDAEELRFAALYLPESARHPVMPIKTLIMPVRRFAPDERLTLRSVTALYTILLKEPIEEQSEFLWLPFDIIARRSRRNPASTGALAPE